ncbi:MAG: hypothetical protein V3S20_02095 [Dehalococcoidia bacterium]
MRRNTLFVLIILGGFALAIVGFALSAPIGATDGPSISNPRMDFAPLLFVLGIIMIFSSALVYELAGD